MDALTPQSEIPSEDASLERPTAPHRTASTQKRYTHGRTDPEFRNQWLATARENCFGFIVRRDWTVRLATLLAAAPVPFVAIGLRKGFLHPPTSYDRNTLFACAAGIVVAALGAVAYSCREIRKEMRAGEYDARLIEAAATEAWPGGNLPLEDVPSRTRKKVATAMGLGKEHNYPFPNA